MTDAATMALLKKLRYSSPTLGDAVLFIAGLEDLEPVINAISVLDEGLLPIFLERYVQKKYPNLLDRPQFLKKILDVRKGSDCFAKIDFTHQEPDPTTCEPVGYTAAFVQSIRREHSRRSKEFAEADNIRKYLMGKGVQLDDSSLVFTLETGYRGSFRIGKAPGVREIELMCFERRHRQAEGDLWGAEAIKEVLLRYGASVDDATATYTTAQGARGSCDITAPYSGNGPVCYDLKFSHVHSRLRDRESARRRGNLKEANHIASQLEGMGVVIDDEKSTFVMPDNEVGTIGEITASDVQTMTLEREVARRARNFKDADNIKLYLETLGIELDDRNHVWRLPNGYKGQYDTPHNQKTATKGARSSRLPPDMPTLLQE